MIISKTAKTKWNPTTREYYESKGYIFSKYNDEFEVKVEDLKPNSTVVVKVKCDYCCKVKELKYNNYIASISDKTGKYACSKCVKLKTSELHKEENEAKLYKRYQELIDCMISRGYTPTCDFKDFHT